MPEWAWYIGGVILYPVGICLFMVFCRFFVFNHPFNYDNPNDNREAAETQKAAGIMCALVWPATLPLLILAGICGLMLMLAGISGQNSR